MSGYWDAIVSPPGNPSSKTNKLQERFFSPIPGDWINIIGNIPFLLEDALVIQEDISAPIFWETIDQCQIGDEFYAEGVGAVVTGTVDAQLWYGFSMIV